MRAFVETKRILHVFSRAKKPGEATLKVEINVYGSLEDANVIGDKLCSAKLYLQDPDHGTQYVEYCNPHEVKFPGIEEPKPQNQGLDLLPDSCKPSKAVREEQENFDQTVSSIYQFLTRSRNLERMQGGSHVVTPLLPYVLSSGKG
jgi:SWI/SNF-related matrix-associated actin-dependent regulator of chromatin subfamily A3